jgi:WD40 repeat protein
MASWRAEALLRCTQPAPVPTLEPKRYSDAASSGSNKGAVSKIAFRSCAHDSGRAVAIPTTDGTSSLRSVIQTFETKDSSKGQYAEFIGSRVIPHAWPIRCSAWAGNALVVGSGSGKLAVLSFDPTDDSAIDASDTIEVTLPDAKPLKSLRVPPSAPATSVVVSDLQVETDGTLAAISGTTVHVFSQAGDEKPHWSRDNKTRMNSHGSVNTCLSLTESSLIAVGSIDGRVTLSDTRAKDAGLAIETGGRGTPSETTRCSARAVEDVRFNRCFPTIFAASRGDGSVQIFDVRCVSGPLLQVPDAVDSIASRVCFVPCTTDLLAVGSTGSLVRLWCLRNSSPQLLGTLAATGDAIVGLHAVTVDTCDTIITVDRSGAMHTAALTEAYLRGIAPTLNTSSLRPSSAEGASALRKRNDAAAALYARNLSQATADIVQAVRSSLAAGDAAVATRGSDMIQELEWTPAEFGDPDIQVTLAQDFRKAVEPEKPKAAKSKKHNAKRLSPQSKRGDDGGTTEDDEVSTEQTVSTEATPPPEATATDADGAPRGGLTDGRVGQAARLLLEKPYAVTSNLRRYAENFPDESTQAALAKKFTLTKNDRTLITSIEREVSFVRALEAADPKAMKANLEQVIDAVVQARLDPTLLAQAAQILLDAQYVEEMLTLLENLARTLHGAAGKEVTEKSLPHACAILKVMLDPMVPTMKYNTGSEWLTGNLDSCDAAAEYAGLVHAWVKYDAGMCPGAEFLSAVGEFMTAADDESAASTIPAPTFIMALVNATLEEKPDDLVKACVYVQQYGSATNRVSSASGIVIAETSQELANEDAAAAEADLRDVVVSSVDAHIENGGDLSGRLMQLAETIHATSTTQRMAAEAKLDGMLDEVVSWLDVALSLRTHLAAHDGTNGCILTAPIWQGYDPLETLEDPIVAMLDAWAALLAEAAEDFPLRNKLKPAVERLVGAVETLASDADIALEGDDGAMLSAILEECGEFLDPSG